MNFVDLFDAQGTRRQTHVVKEPGSRQPHTHAQNVLIPKFRRVEAGKKFATLAESLGCVCREHAIGLYEVDDTFETLTGFQIAEAPGFLSTHTLRIPFHDVE